jgi:Sensors of blue-light using FAD
MAHKAVLLTKLVYTSRHGGLNASACDDIQLTSCVNNTRDEITGVLVCGPEDFLQTLEGGREVVAACFTRIINDYRHTDIRVLMACETEVRLFSGWHMHCIKSSTVYKKILSHYLIDGKFDPAFLSQSDIEDLCKALAENRLHTH